METKDKNLEFLELYKSVDRFIRDAYATSEGVSEYIRNMESKSFLGSNVVLTWATDYKELKRARWIRNQLSHEVGSDAEILKDRDLAWMETFLEKLHNAVDPLSIVLSCEIEKEKLDRETAERAKQDSAKAVHGQSIMPDQSKPAIKIKAVNKPKRKSLLERIKDYFNGY